jgi:hypothetical protein
LISMDDTRTILELVGVEEEAMRISTRLGSSVLDTHQEYFDCLSGEVLPCSPIKPLALQRHFEIQSSNLQ